MVKNRKMRGLMWVLTAAFILFQCFTVAIYYLRKYYLIYDSIFFIVNYVIILMLILLFSGGRLKEIKLVAFIFLIAANTFLFYYMGDTKIVSSKSPDGRYEVVFKEYEKRKNETMRLKRRWLIYGKSQGVLTGSTSYKILSSGKYKIQWITDDAALMVYDANGRNEMRESIVTFADRGDSISYYNVLPMLQGKWVCTDGSNDAFIVGNGDIVYETNGQSYYYNGARNEQYGVTSFVLYGENGKQDLAVTMNPDCVILPGTILQDGGSINIVEASLDDKAVRTFKKQ